CWTLAKGFSTILHSCPPNLHSNPIRLPRMTWGLVYAFACSHVTINDIALLFTPPFYLYGALDRNCHFVLTVGLWRRQGRIERGNHRVRHNGHGKRERQIAGLRGERRSARPQPCGVNQPL